jgi:thiol-disulfide isomerase/thioredoxin
MTLLRIFSVLLLSPFLGGFTGMAGPVQTAPAAVAAGKIGSRLPEFAVKDLQRRKISSAALRGKVVLIDFWGTWCQPCKKEMPGYQRLLDRYGSKGFAVIGLKLNVMPDTEPPLRFAQKLGVRYPLVAASDDLIQKFGGVEGLPTTLMYDRNGVLRWKIIGFEYTKVVEAEVKRLL